MSHRTEHLRVSDQNGSLPFLELVHLSPSPALRRTGSYSRNCLVFWSKPLLVESSVTHLRLDPWHDAIYRRVLCILLEGQLPYHALSLSSPCFLLSVPPCFRDLNPCPGFFWPGIVLAVGPVNGSLYHSSPLFDSMLLGHEISCLSRDPFILITMSHPLDNEVELFVWETSLTPLSTRKKKCPHLLLKYNNGIPVQTSSQNQKTFFL